MNILSKNTDRKTHIRSNIIIIVALLGLLWVKYGPEWSNLSREGTITIMVMIIMAVFWVFEPIPIYATALIPLAVFPLFQVNSFQEVAFQYANKNIYLFLGGFILALAMEASGLHIRMALHILRSVGTKPANIIAGFIIAPGILSMWISNTATAVLMMPIAFSIIQLLKGVSTAEQIKSFTIAILLSIAFSSSVGGMATFIGTPPNAIFSAFATDIGLEIGFGQFMLLGIPIALGGFFIIWFLFTKILFKLGRDPIEGAADLLEERIQNLPKISVAEKRVLGVFLVTASLWIFRKLISKHILVNIGLSLSDPGIAIIAGLTLFLLSNGQGRRIINWKDTIKLPWGILLLFGGGLALGKEIQNTGVGIWVADGLKGPLSQIPLIMIIIIVTLVATIISQFASNTATTAAFLPIFFPLAQATNIHPLFIMLPLTLGASAVFMLPSATPPNAIVLSGEGLEVRDMVKYGGILNIVFVAFLIGIIYLYLKLNIGFDIGDGTFEYFAKKALN